MDSIFASPPAIYGSAVAGVAQVSEVEAVRNKLEHLVAHLEKSTFDVAELLYTVKTQKPYLGWGFNTYKEYTRSIGLKDRKADYLPKIVEVMSATGVPRTQYEPLGMVRLREISSLDPNGVWKNPNTNVETPMKEFIVGLVEKGEAISMEDLKQSIRTLKGFIGENDLVCRHFWFTRLTSDSVIDPALELARRNLGSSGKDDDGTSKDASEGACAEAWAVEYLNNPANNILAEGEG